MKPLRWAVPVHRLNLATLGKSLQQVEDAGGHELLLAVRDGRFTPDFGLGFETLAAVLAASKLPCHVHLQVEQPDRHIERFAEAGCKSLSVHVEACLHAPRTLSHIREAGMSSGIAINPATPLTRLEYVLPYADRVLLVLQEPGATGAELPGAAFERIKIMRESLDYDERGTNLQVEGAWSPADNARLIELGADSIVLSAPTLYDHGDLLATLSAYVEGVDRARNTV